MALDLAGVELLTECVHSARLVLRPWRATDADAVYAACQDRQSQRWLTALPAPYTHADAVRYVTEAGWVGRRAATSLDSAITSVVDGTVLGSASLLRLTEMFGPEIGYWVAPPARRHGYAAEATDALARWAFAHGAHRVCLLAAPGNVASCATAARAGFSRDGLLREQERARDGSRRDLAIYTRLATDVP